MNNNSLSARSELKALWKGLREEYPMLAGWSFVIDTRIAKTRLGQCRFIPKEVAVSEWALTACDLDTVKNTLRHEAAHALAGPYAKHGPHWKRWARAVGARPERLVALKPHEEAAAPKSLREERGWKYSAVCSKCGKIPGSGKMRMTKKWAKGTKHRTCGGSPVSWVQNW